MERDGNKVCPHCGEPLESWEPCSESGWDHDLLMCDNDTCSYFTRGRKKIAEECEANFGYRYCYDPEKGTSVAMAAWCGGDLSYRKGRAPGSRTA
jgi:hypothetical protein